MADTSFIAALAQARDLHAKGHWTEAESLYAMLARKNPNNVELLHLRGLIAFQRRRLDEALPLLRRAASAVPGNYKYRLNYSLALGEDGQLEAALNEIEAAYELKPDSPEILTNLGNMHRNVGQSEDSRRLLLKGARMGLSDPDCQSNYLYGLIFDTADGAAVAAAHFEWGRRVASSVAQRRHKPRVWDPERRIRLGFVSGDLREHSVAFFLMPLLQALDRTQVELWAYASLTNPDGHTEKFKSWFHHWRNIRGMDDESLASLIIEDSIDILVDLSGHTAGNRQLALARKPAPIQIGYLGYPHHSGLPQLDYRVSDGLADPDGRDFPDDRVWRLPRCAWCFDADLAIQPLPPAKAVGRVLTFGSFNQVGKITPQTISLWCQVLRAVPHSRLLLKARSFSDPLASYNIREKFLREKIDLGRLELFGWTATRKENLEAYRHIDIALDTYPYNGTTTTCEALWMGVPVVTLSGRSHASRVGASLLANCGLSWCVAGDEAEFVRIAGELAADRSRLDSIKEGLRGRMLASPLMDKKEMAGAFGEMLRAMWRAKCLHEAK